MNNIISQIGYVPVKLPKEGIEPLALLRGNKNNVNRIGGLDELIGEKEKIDFPALTEGVCADVEGRVLIKTDIQFGLQLFEKLLRNLGGEAAGLNVAFNHAKTLSFIGTKITDVGVSVLALEKLLRKQTVAEQIDDLFANNSADDIYIIANVLKSNSFAIEAFNENDQKIDLKLPEIKKIIKGGIGVNNAKSNENKIEFSGVNRLTFGFKALRVEPKNSDSFKFWKKPVGGYLLKAVTGLNLNE